MIENFEKRPIDIGIGDLINAIFLNPVDAVARSLEGDEEKAQRQIRPATPQELAEVEALAFKTAALQDELKSLLERFVAAKSRELSVLKDQLLDRMLTHNLTEVYVPGRPAIEVVVKNERKASKKSLLAAMTKILGDPKKAAVEATRLWNSIPQVQKESLAIPDPTPPEIDSPY